MIEITLHGKNGSRTIKIRTPLGFSTRHVRTAKRGQRAEQAPPVSQRKPEPESSPKPPPSKPPVPACPVLAALQKLTDYYPDGDNYFIFDEIFLTVRQECSITRDALLETLRSYYSDGQIAFRPGFGSQLQFALAEVSNPADLSPTSEAKRRQRAEQATPVSQRITSAQEETE